MSKRQYRKPGAFRVEDVEVFVPEARVSEARVPEVPPLADEAVPVPHARVLPDLQRGLRWGSDGGAKRYGQRGLSTHHNCRTTVAPLHSSNAQTLPNGNIHSGDTRS